MNLGLREMLRSADAEQPIVGAWALLMAVAASDGVVTSNERETVRQRVLDLFGLSPEDFANLESRLRPVESDPNDIEVYSRYVRDGAPMHVDSWLVDAVRDVGWADGRPDLARMRAMLRVADAVEMAPTGRRRILQPPE